MRTNIRDYTYTKVYNILNKYKYKFWSTDKIVNSKSTSSLYGLQLYKNEVFKFAD